MRTNTRTRRTAPTAPRVRPRERFTVTVDAHEALVYRSVEAGVCGPAERTVVLPETLDGVDAWLDENRYQRTSPWRIVSAYDGLRMEADLDPINDQGGITPPPPPFNA